MNAHTGAVLLSAMRTLSLNGDTVHTEAPTIADLLAERGYDTTRAMACAVNQQFVPRNRWAQYALQPGDAIEVVSPVVGG
ncbi:sulfur carrier protein ThiS [mine drainage metagenome]|uniref:Sulfur carrier protein ThiS n=1 Tax=mine drainage metagenome TaxID=410659 RepID=A0A1J5PXG2_9ZZZZ